MNSVRSSFDKNSSWYPGLTLVLIVLAVLGTLLPGINVGRITLFPFRLALIAYVPIVFLSVILQKSIRFPRPILPFVAFLAIISLNIWKVINSGYLRREAILFSINIALFISIIVSFRDREWVYRGWKIFGILSILAFMIGGVEYFTGWHFAGSQLHLAPDRPPYSTWVTAWFRNVNDLSFFLVFSGTYWFVRSIQPSISMLKRISLLLPWIGGLLLSIHLGARAGTIAHIVVSIAALLLMHSRAVQLVCDKFTIRIGQVSAVLIGIVITLVFIVVPNPFSQATTSLWIRWQLQKAAVLTGGFFGNGIGSAATVILQSDIVTFGKGSPHSWFGSIIADTGLFGLLSFLMFYGGVTARNIEFSGTKDPIYIMGATALISLPIAALGPSNAVFLRSFWIVLGLGVSSVYISYRRR